MKARATARRAGKVVRSVEQIFAVPHTTRATSYEKAGERNPSFAAGGNAELATMAARIRAAFLGAYRDALREFRSGVREVLFPEGTWRWFRDLGVNVVSTT